MQRARLRHAASKRLPGNHIYANDGVIGHIQDFLIEDADWRIKYLVVDTKNWWPGKTVLISSRSVQEIDWTDNQVNLNVDRQKVKDDPRLESSMTVNRAYEEKHCAYYDDGLPGTLT